ncbi:MAG: biotin--[acetyl-CoA-carboxylase] ligase [Thiomicrospira sp.]
MEYYYFDTLDSTSRFLLNFSKQRLVPAVCVAEKQTAGYGQFGRHWDCFSASALFSVLIPFSVPCHVLTGLSQQVAITVHRCIAPFVQSELFLKWPNDLYLADKKLAGILIEVAKCQHNLTWLVIGIGINNMLQKEESIDIAFLHLSLAQRDELIQRIVNELQYLSFNWTPQTNLFEREYWLHYDYFRLGEVIDLCFNVERESFYYHGLSQTGGVIASSLACPSEKKIYAHGEVSLRKRVCCVSS